MTVRWTVRAANDRARGSRENRNPPGRAKRHISVSFFIFALHGSKHNTRCVLTFARKFVRIIPMKNTK